MEYNELSPSGRQRGGPPGLQHSGYPLVVLTIVLISFVVWVVLVGQRENWTSPLVDWMVLKTGNPKLQAFIVHSFFYHRGLHLAGTLLAFLYAGWYLESRWGSLRFGAFYLFVTLSTAAVSLLLYPVVSGILEDPDAASRAGAWIFGGAAAGFASLAVLSFLEEDRWLMGVFSRKYVIWSLVLVGAGGLILVENVERGTEAPTVFLLPQVSGVFFGWAFTRFLPMWDGLLLRWEVRRRRTQEEKVKRIRNRVDELLEKISRDGMESLSEEERSFLDQASKHYRRHI